MTKENAVEEFGLIDTKEKAINKYEFIDNSMYDARGRINNPTGEHVLHYDIVKRIKRKSPDVIVTSGLGENQITHCTRFDSYHKGYEAGTPGIELTRKVGDYTVVVAILYDRFTQIK